VTEFKQEQDLRSRGVAQHVPLSDLLLDPENPRLPAEMHGKDQEELLVQLELGFEALTVAESIASHGFFGSEPLIVIKGENDGKWLVVEGNRRLTALRGLADANLRSQFANPKPWEALSARADVSYNVRVPVIVLPDRASATPIIGFRHISGILQWQPYAQARYIARLVDEDKMTFTEVAEMIGIDRTRVGNLYRDQAIAKQARSMGIDTGQIEEAFSLLTVAMSNTKLRDHIGAQLGSKTVPGEHPIPQAKESALRELIGWVYGDGIIPPVIHDSREISKLGNVVASDVGLKALRNDESLDMAVQRIKDEEINPRQRLVARLRTGRNSLNTAMEDIDGFQDDQEIRDLIEEVRGAVDALMDAMG